MMAVLPKGTYYIGDPCYILDNKIYDDVWGKLYGYKDGEYEFEGKKFFIAGTKYGDGLYKSNYNNLYGVDSGTLGVINSLLADKDKLETALGLGGLITSDSPVIVERNEDYTFIIKWDDKKEIIPTMEV